MSKLYTIAIFLIVHALLHAPSAHSSVSVPDRLLRLKPSDNVYCRYTITPPNDHLALGEEIALDLLYKIRSTQPDRRSDSITVALRFERHPQLPRVRASEFVYTRAYDSESFGSKPASRHFTVAHGSISKHDFDHILERSYYLYASDIAVSYDDMTGFLPSSPCEYLRQWSFGNKNIAIILREVSGQQRVFINELGILWFDSVRDPVDYSYNQVRAHLFWEGFHEHLAPHVLWRSTSPEQAVQMALARLVEPVLLTGYDEYKRRRLYIDFIGMFGGCADLEPLENVLHLPSIPDSLVDFDPQIHDLVSRAIEDILSRGACYHIVN